MSLHSRRDFLRDGSLMTAASLALAQMSHGQDEKKKKEKKITAKVSANDRIRMAVIGVNGRGMDHIKGFASMPETEIVMLCDPDQRIAEKGVKGVKELQEKEPGFVQDLRRIMDDKTIDAVSIATPNHWHSLAAIWAIQAGKDVYVEKPISHNVGEGRRIVEVARKNNKIVQTGTQSRSNEGMQQVMNFIHSGKIGACQTGVWPVLQASWQHRADDQSLQSARNLRLQSVVRSGSDGSSDAHRRPLRVALVLEHRQR